MKISIRYHAEYLYDSSVSLSPHVVRLFPRRDVCLEVDAMRFSAEGATDISHRADIFGNTIAVCFFPNSQHSLKIGLDLDLRVRERNPFHFLLASHAVTMPFTYLREEAEVLAPYLKVSDAGFELPGVFKFPVGAPTVDVLAAWNAVARELVAYERREHGDPHAPAETLRRGRGSCRDIAVLFAEVLRCQGIAARLVSGFLWERPDDKSGRVAENSLHAWVEACLPGAGWVGMDPTNGVFADHHRIAAAVGIHPHQIAPVEGRYFSDSRVDSHLEASLSISEQ
jgi:transglutaminase-like putative cysteine protease